MSFTRPVQQACRKGSLNFALQRRAAFFSGNPAMVWVYYPQNDVWDAFFFPLHLPSTFSVWELLGGTSSTAGD